MANVRTLKLNLLGDVSDFKKGLNKAEAETKSFSGSLKTSMKTVAKSAAVAGAAVGGLAVAFGVDAVKAAIADEKSQKRLANSLKNTTKATNKQVASAEKWISRQQFAYGVSDDKLRPSLAKLAGVTGDVSEAQDLLSLGLDISAGSGKDLESVTNILTRAQQGNLTGLKKLGVPLSDATIKNHDLATALEQTGAQFGGAAATNADTFAGKMQNFSQRMGEAKESIGKAILQAIQPFVEEWLPKLSTGVGHFVDGLVGSDDNGGLKGAAEDSQTAIYNLGEKTRGFFKFLGDHEEMLKRIATVIGAIFIGAKASAAVSAMVTAVKLLIPAFETVTVAAGTTAAAEAAATGGASLWAAAPAIIGIATALGLGGLAAMYTWKGSKSGGEQLNKTLKNIKSGVPTDFSGSVTTTTGPGAQGGNTADLFGPQKTKLYNGTVYIWDPVKKLYYVPDLSGNKDYSVQPKALGGPVSGGRSYLVGEHGPEMFTPMGGGTITPNSRLGGGTTIINLNGIIDAESARRTIERVLQESSLRTGAINLQGSLI